MKLRIVAILLAVFTFSSVNSQMVFAKPKEFKEIKERILLVETLVLDLDQISDWRKKIDKNESRNPKRAKKFAEMIEEYKTFIDVYNNSIKAVVEEYWKLNEQIEYRTKSQLEIMSKNDEYAVLWYSETAELDNPSSSWGYFPGLTIPTMNYSRFNNKKSKKSDYSIFIPHTGNRKNPMLNESDLILTLGLMQTHIAEIQNIDKKYSFGKYAKEEAKENCKSLKSNDVYLHEGDIHKSSSLEEIQSAYKNGEVNDISENEISEAIKNKEDKIIAFTVPLMTVSGSIGPFGFARITYIQILVNVKDYDIYAYSGTGFSDMTLPSFRDKEFKGYMKCK